MTCTYTLMITAKCPRDDSLTDVYGMTVTSPRMIEVESILRAVAEYTKRAVYQEDLAEQLALWLDAEVELTGVHSSVRTRVVA